MDWEMRISGHWVQCYVDSQVKKTEGKVNRNRDNRRYLPWCYAFRRSDSSGAGVVRGLSSTGAVATCEDDKVAE